MLVGYARVSTPEQNLDSQRDALEKAGCVRTFTDIASGARTQRQGLIDALNFLRAGDTLVVWKLDRLGRSLPHLIEESVKKSGVSTQAADLQGQRQDRSNISHPKH